MTNRKSLLVAAPFLLMFAGPAIAQFPAQYFTRAAGNCGNYAPQGVLLPVPSRNEFDCSATLGGIFMQASAVASTSGGLSPMVDAQVSLIHTAGYANAYIFYWFRVSPVNASVPVNGVTVPVNILTRASVSFNGATGSRTSATVTATLSDGSKLDIRYQGSGNANQSQGVSKQYQLLMAAGSEQSMFIEVNANGNHNCSSPPETCSGSLEMQAVVDPLITIDPSFPMRDQYKIVLSGNLLAIPRDFAGNAHSDALLYVPSSGTAYTALSNGDGTYQYAGNLFTPAFDTLRTGDFNADGKADLVLYNSHNALAYIGMSKGDGTFTFQSLFWSPGYDFVEAGDLNGDGRTDFALYNSVTGTMYTALSNGSGGFAYKYTLISASFTFVRLADFTGDGKADIFVYNAANGAAYLGVGGGDGAFAFHPLFISPGYDLADVGDLNGDGKADLILYNSVKGSAATGISDGTGDFAFSAQVFSPGFTSVRLADHNGDGKADAIVYNRNTASAYFGIGTGAGTFNFQSLFWSPGYDWVVPQDVNGDGYVDVVLYNSSTGTEYTGVSNGVDSFSYSYSLWGIGRVLAR